MDFHACQCRRASLCGNGPAAQVPGPFFAVIEESRRYVLTQVSVKKDVLTCHGLTIKKPTRTWVTS